MFSDVKILSLFLNSDKQKVFVAFMPTVAEKGQNFFFLRRIFVF